MITHGVKKYEQKVWMELKKKFPQWELQGTLAWLMLTQYSHWDQETRGYFLWGPCFPVSMVVAPTWCLSHGEVWYRFWLIMRMTLNSEGRDSARLYRFYSEKHKNPKQLHSCLLLLAAGWAAETDRSRQINYFGAENLYLWSAVPFIDNWLTLVRPLSVHCSTPAKT